MICTGLLTPHLLNLCKDVNCRPVGSDSGLDPREYIGHRLKYAYDYERRYLEVSVLRTKRLECTGIATTAHNEDASGLISWYYFSNSLIYVATAVEVIKREYVEGRGWLDVTSSTSRVQHGLA